jgi:hypothetical protein
MKNKAKNYDDMLFLQIELLMDLYPLKNSSIIFNLWHDEWLSSLPMLSQINIPLQIQSSQHLICQHLCFDSNFIEGSPTSSKQNFMFFIWT